MGSLPVARIFTDLKGNLIAPDCKMLVFSLETHEDVVSKLCENWKFIPDDYRQLLSVAGRVHDHLKPTTLWFINVIKKIKKEELKNKRKRYLANLALPHGVIEKESIWEFEFPKHGDRLSEEYLRRLPEVAELDRNNMSLITGIVKLHHSFQTDKIVSYLKESEYFPLFLHTLIQADWIDAEICSHLLEHQFHISSSFEHQFFDYQLKFEDIETKTTVRIEPYPLIKSPMIVNVKFVELNAPSSFPENEGEMNNLLSQQMKKVIESGWKKVEVEIK